MKVLPQEVASHDPGLRTIHWLMAALIFVTLPLGVWASLLPSGGGARIETLFFHKSIGVTVWTDRASHRLAPHCWRAGLC
jgi:cytochrome b561